MTGTQGPGATRLPDGTTAVLENLVGAPLVLEELKNKPGRRRTLQATGPDGSVVVKVYASPRAAVVASRVGALAAGPSEPVVPRVLHVGAGGHLLVLSRVPGEAFTGALLGGDLPKCRRTGEALGRWHQAWRGVAPSPLRPHGVERELEILQSRADAAPPQLAELVHARAASLGEPWAAATVVHRDLYEEQIVLGDTVGLIDLDDVALGPAELDIGNLLAHIELLAHRRGGDISPPADALLEGYARTGPTLQPARLDQCWRLSLLRLACIHHERGLIAAADGPHRGVAAPARPGGGA